MLESLNLSLAGSTTLVTSTASLCLHSKRLSVRTVDKLHTHKRTRTLSQLLGRKVNEAARSITLTIGDKTAAEGSIEIEIDAGDLAPNLLPQSDTSFNVLRFYQC